MARFLSCGELYETIQQKSSVTKEILWVCSPSLGLDAHEIFSQEIIKNPPADIRFVFRVDEAAVKRGKVNPYEIQYFMEHFKSGSIRIADGFHSNIYIFDNAALITSASLTKTAFENDVEAGVLLEGHRSRGVKSFFDQRFMGTLKNGKRLKEVQASMEQLKRAGKNSNPKKSKPHTIIKDWTNDYVQHLVHRYPQPNPAKNRTQDKKRNKLATKALDCRRRRVQLLQRN